MDLSKLRRTSDTFLLIQVDLLFFSKKKKEVVLVWSNLDLNLLSSNQTQSCSQDTPKKKKTNPTSTTRLNNFQPCISGASVQQFLLAVF